MRTVLFINEHSRQAKILSDLVQYKLNESKRFEIVKVIKVSSLNGLDKSLNTLARLKSIECVLVGSGDGTIDAVLNKMKDRKDIVYGFLPLGTGNAFVRSTGMPIEVEEALARLEKTKTKKVSLGEVNGHLFANIAAVGMPVSVSLNISNVTKRIFGQTAYVLSGVKNLVTHKPMLCTMITDGKEYSFFTHHLLIANGRYHGHLPVSRHASVYKNKLVLVAFGVRRSRLHYVYAMVLFELGLHKKARYVKLIPFKSAQLDIKPMHPVEIDGEVVTHTPVEVRIIPNAIKLLAD